MTGDYLWDPSAEPDPEVQRLEATLRPLRKLPPPPPLAGRRAVWPGLAAAAAVLLALGSLPLGIATPTGWNVVWLDGAGAEAARLPVGGALETGDRHARLEVGRIGQVRLEPATRVSLVDAGRRLHRLALEHGTLHATIWAPPGQFVVDTRAALAVDLGCAYTLQVARDGTGLLRVETGWVGIDHRGTRALVPAGALCRTRPGTGPGTPRFETATPAFAAALDALDSSPTGEEARRALRQVLAEARPRDALSLWHLLSRLPEGPRGTVHDALAAVVPPPPGVTREGISRGEGPMLRLWWDELGLGSSEFWEAWTGHWSDGQMLDEARQTRTDRASEAR